LLLTVAAATEPDALFAQAKNPKGLTPEQVAAIHGRIFRMEEAGAIPAALSKGGGDVYIYSPTSNMSMSRV
jgi:hypothetical protein